MVGVYVFFFIQILWEVDTILFSLLILRGLCDSQGRVWRCHPNQFYAVEVTVPNVALREKGFLPESRTLSLLNLLPSVTCPSPRKVLEYFIADQQSKFSILYHNTVYLSNKVISIEWWCLIEVKITQICAVGKWPYFRGAWSRFH